MHKYFLIIVLIDWVTQNFSSSTARVCSIHFRDEDYEKKQTETQTGFSPQNRRQLLPKAVPSLLLPGCSFFRQDFTDLAAPLETVAERTAASPAFPQDSSKAEKIPKGNPFAR